ncbi:hypothetical protein IWZ00DRAFT_485238 [Phyllosticta capitalensis]
MCEHLCGLRLFPTFSCQITDLPHNTALLVIRSFLLAVKLTNLATDDAANAPDLDAHSLDVEKRHSLIPTAYQPTYFDRRAEWRYQSTLVAANRLIWDDGFQHNIIKAVRTLHIELRPILRADAAETTSKKTKDLCNVIGESLDEWSRRNRMLCDDIYTLDFNALREASQIDGGDCTQRILSLKHIIRTMIEKSSHVFAYSTLPSISGCEANLVAISFFQQYFSEDVDFFFTPNSSSVEDLYYLVPAERQTRACLLQLRDSFHGCKATAKWLLDDGTSVWQEFGSNAGGAYPAQTSLTTMVSPVANDDGHEKETNKKQGIVDGKRARMERTLGGLLGRFGARATDEDRNSIKNDKKPKDDGSMSISVPFNLHYLGGLSRPGSHPRLDAFPQATLEELEHFQMNANQQKEIPCQKHILDDAMASDEEHATAAKHQVGAPPSVGVEEADKRDSGPQGVESLLEDSNVESLVAPVSLEKHDGEPGSKSMTLFWRNRALECLERRN